MKKIIYIVIPCYNEEEMLPITATKMKEKMVSLVLNGKISERSKVLFVNDGSKDKTWEIIKDLHNNDKLFLGLNLSRNRGHQNALLAGLMYSKENCDAAITIDADLQDDINAIDEMIESYLNGIDIVYGVRKDRKKDKFFKRFTAELFYRLINSLGAETVFNHADFRLMSKRAIEGLGEFKETNLFLRGIVPMIGYNTGYVYYQRNERIAGKTKYPLKKMISFALQGITSLSVKPIRLITVSGFLVFLVSIAVIIYSIIRNAFGQTVPGWTSMMASIWGIGGLILLAIGIVGEYIGKIYLETKMRPRYIVEEILDDKRNKDR